MVGRPKLMTDARVLEAAGRALSHAGPGVSLAEVASEAGLATATLVQRFGSKRGLLLALARSGVGVEREVFATAREDSGGSALEAMVLAVSRMPGVVTTPEELANRMAFDQEGLADPEFHAIALERARGFEREVRRLLDEAIATGELRECETGRLARAIFITYSGALASWSVLRKGSLESWVRGVVEFVVAPYRASSAGEAG